MKKRISNFALLFVAVNLFSGCARPLNATSIEYQLDPAMHNYRFNTLEFGVGFDYKTEDKSDSVLIYSEDNTYNIGVKFLKEGRVIFSNKSQIEFRKALTANGYDKLEFQQFELFSVSKLEVLKMKYSYIIDDEVKSESRYVINDKYDSYLMVISLSNQNVIAYDEKIIYTFRLS